MNVKAAVLHLRLVSIHWTWRRSAVDLTIDVEMRVVARTNIFLKVFVPDHAAAQMSANI